MKTFVQFVESFGLESLMDVYYRLGGDGKKSIPHPEIEGFYIHPNGIVGPDLPEGTEHHPAFDPLKIDQMQTVMALKRLRVPNC